MAAALLGGGSLLGFVFFDINFSLLYIASIASLHPLLLS